MRKHLFILFVLTLIAVGLFAQNTPRVLNVRMVNQDGSALPNVPADITWQATINNGSVNTLIQSSPGCGFTYGGGQLYAKIELGNFSAQWVNGNTVTINIQRVSDGATGSADNIVLAGTGTIWWGREPVATYGGAPVMLIPPTPTATYTVNMSTVPVGYITPNVLGPTTDPTTIYGTYTPTPLPAPATGYWTPASLTIGPATVWTAVGDNWVLNQEFVWTEVNTYMYNLYVTGPDGYAVTGPVAGVTDYMASDAVQANLLGMYNIAAAPAGFHWVVNPIEVTTDGWAMVTKKGAVAGTRSSAPKAHFVYEKTIEFVLAPDPVETYTIQVNGPAGYHVTGPVSGDLPYNAIDDNDMINDLIGTYTVEPAPAGFHWIEQQIVVEAADFVGNMAVIEFFLIANVIDVENPPAGIVIVPGGNNGMPGSDAGMPAVIYTVTASGVWDVVVTKPAGYPYPWYAYINATPMLASGPIMVDTYTFIGVDFGAKAKGPLVITLDDDESLTLPVELSSFTAVLTAQNFVKLTWVSQSETEMLGYRVYRSESGDQANAIMITPTMIGATNTSTTQTYSITDNEVAVGSTYWYWLESVDYASSHFHGPVSIIVEGNVPPVLPEVTSLRNAYPNPFRMNSATNIEVAVKAGETGTVTIYNILGQAVKTFTVREGFHKINWNGRDAKGNVCGSGIYFYKLSTPSMNQTKKMVIVK